MSTRAKTASWRLLRPPRFALSSRSRMPPYSPSLRSLSLRSLSPRNPSPRNPSPRNPSPRNPSLRSLSARSPTNHRRLSLLRDSIKRDSIKRKPSPGLILRSSTIRTIRLSPAIRTPGVRAARRTSRTAEPAFASERDESAGNRVPAAASELSGTILGRWVQVHRTLGRWTLGHRTPVAMTPSRSPSRAARLSLPQTDSLNSARSISDGLKFDRPKSGCLIVARPRLARR